MKKNDEKILKWRLSEKPTAASLQDLVKSQIITKEEARQILLDETEFNSKDFDDVLEEMKLLRKLVLEVAERQPQTIIKIIESNPVYIRDYPRYPWIQPYVTWCANTAQTHNYSLSSNMLNAATNLLASGTDGTIYKA